MSGFRCGSLRSPHSKYLLAYSRTKSLQMNIRFKCCLKGYSVRQGRSDCSDKSDLRR